MLPLFVNLGKDAPAEKKLCVTHLDDGILYISIEKEFLFMIQATKPLEKTP